MRRLTRLFVETSILDLAGAILLIRWIRRRGEIQSLNIWTPYYPAPVVDDLLMRASGAQQMPWGKYRRVSILVDLIRRLICSQAFFFLVAACFNKRSWLNREMRSFWRMILRKDPDPSQAAILRADARFPDRRER